MLPTLFAPSGEHGSPWAALQGRGTSPALLSSHLDLTLRRVIKPFAVEVRSTTRRTRMEAPKPPVWPDLAEQPDVEWPEALVASAADPEPAIPQPTERALPTQAEPIPSALAEPYRDPRKPPPAFVARTEATSAAEPEQVAHVVAPEEPPEKPPGRILPVIEIEMRSDAEDVTTRAPAARPKRPKPTRAAEPVAEVPLVVMPPEIDTAAVAATLLLRQSRERLTRDDFKRGERWKARLPAAAQRAKRR